MPKKKKLPKTVYLRWDFPDNGEPWLMNGKSPADMLEAAADTKQVGVYKLEKIVTVKSTVKLEVSE